MTENIHPQPPPSDARLATAEDETNVVPTMATATATDTAPSSSLLDSAALPSTSQLAVPSSADDATDRPSTPTPLTLRPAIPLHPGSLEDMSPFMTEPNKEVSESPITYKPTMDAPVLEHHDTRPRSATDATVSPRRVQQASLSPRARSRTVGANSLRGSADDDLPTMGSIRVGTSALVSALTALPWDNDTDDEASTGDHDDDRDAIPMAKTSLLPVKPPKFYHLNSSLHTMRPMDMTPFKVGGTDEEDEVDGTGEHLTRGAAKSGSPPHHHRHRHHHSRLSFPYKENAIARRAHSPSMTELNYQFAPSSKTEDATGGDTDDTVSPQASPLRAFKPVGSNDGASHTDRPRRQSPPDVRVEDTDSRLSEHTKLIRKQKLARRLQAVFGLDEQEEVLEEMTCWLLRSVMLKGYMFLTKRRICFFAHMPLDENTVIRSGVLWKKASQTKINHKHWFVLRNGVLSWYESPKDPYFPKGAVSLQYASSCDSVGGARFKIRTAERNYTFTADTVMSAEEWVKAINKVIFKAQHEGESIKLIVPLEAVVDIELSPTLEFAETIEIKVVDPDDSMSVDSYFFASFPNNEYAYDVLQKLLEDRPSTALPHVSSSATLQTATADNASDSSAPGITVQFGSKIGTVLRPLGLGGEDKAAGDSRVPIAAPPKPSLPGASDTDDNAPMSEASDDDDDDSEVPKGYPPRQSGPIPPGMEKSASWRGNWIRTPAAKLFGTSPGSAELGKRFSIPNRPKPRKRSSVTEVLEPAPPNSDDEDADTSDMAATTSRSPRQSFASMTTPASAHSRRSLPKSKSDYSIADEDPVTHKFHAFFALPEKEELIADCSGSLYRVIPVHGRFYISTNYFCFRSSNLLYKTRMIVPIRDLYGMQAQKAFRFGHSGLIVIIKGHEELFLEFSTSKKRNECMSLLEDRMEALRQGNLPQQTPDEFPDTIMEDLNESIWHSGHLGSLGSPLFGSTASSFLEFKPEPMTIVCLTIGSRGDVQPYIALCKGLQAEGHTCKIATHGEYKDWVEGHGLQFASVGGDPAELMQLCVDNGMFTVSFLKEGLSKFRVWLDDLLQSSWEGCQGADLLIESPSAMAGIHIAEALQVPYYRAFTMPWTRTRSYPHAFAVPELKRGGSYNYMTYVMFDQVFWRAISGQVNRWRMNSLHLEATHLDKLQQDKVPFLYNFSPTVVPPPLDWTEWIHVTGYWFLDRHIDKPWSPPEGIVEFIDSAHARGKKVVYIGFGSIVVSDPQEMTRCVVDAILQSDVCAILSKGWSDRGSREGKEEKEKEEVIEFPDCIYNIDAIDHAWLFPRIDAACHHGGAGTTGASLRAGIPTVIKPFFGDQAFWAERVESLGVGSAIRKLTADALATALLEATTNERQIARAKAVGETIRKENGVQRAIASIYRDLEYAKAIIKPLPGVSHAAEGAGDGRSSLSRKVSQTLGIRSVPATPRRRKSSSRLHTRSHSRGISTDREGGLASDESWSVVSDSGHASQVSSPHFHFSQLSESTGTDENTSSSAAIVAPATAPASVGGTPGGDVRERRESAFAGFSSLVGHWLPGKGTPRGSTTPEPGHILEPDTAAPPEPST